MGTKTDAERLAALEKTVTDLNALFRFQDATIAKMTKAIGIIDWQLVKTDAGLRQLLKTKSTKKPKKKALKPVKKKKARKKK